MSSKPGKTGTINFYAVNENVRLVDLPGYGYAKVSAQEKARWSDLVEGYFNSDRNISFVVQIVDMRHKPTADDINMIEFLTERNFNFVVVLTKSDKLNKTQREEYLKNLEVNFPFENIKFVVFSAVKGEGLAELREIIEVSIE